MLIRNIYLIFLISSFGSRIHAQFYNLPSEYGFSLFTQRELAKRDSSVHASIQPFIPFFSKKYNFVPDSHQAFRYIKNDPVIDLIFRKHFIRVEPKKEKFKLRLDPLLNLEAGKDPADTSGSRLYTNTRGFIGSGHVGDRFYFETMVSENQSFFPRYIAEESEASLVVPGQARWKTFKTTGFDYAFATGFVSIQALKNFNIQVGHGKHKIGNGYRSLLLSDNAFNYPYARLTQQWFKGKVQYTNIYASFMNLVPASTNVSPYAERLFKKKSAAFQYLSMNLSKRFNLSLFQGIIWQAADDRNQQSLDFRYFNPVIYSQLAHFGLNNANNVLIGADALYKLTDKLSAYGQLMADDNANNKTGWQGGVKIYDVFGMRNLFFQAEFNNVGEGSYLQSDSSLASQTYSHYNQVIAYTPVQGKELLFITDYRKKRFFFNVRYHYQEHTTNKKAVDFVQVFQARAGYIINPSYNLNVTVGLTSRSQNFSNFGAVDTRSNYIYVAFRTSLYNLYYDF